MTYPFLSEIPPHCPQALLDRAKSAKTPRVALVNEWTLMCCFSPAEAGRYPAP